jgi:hypothetical protein
MRLTTSLRPVSTTRPAVASATSPKCRKTLVTSSMSISLSGSRLPVSSDSILASWSRSRWSRSATRSRTSPRPRALVCGHDPSSKALRAAPIAASVSTAVDSSISATSSPVAGQRIERRPPARAGTQSPLMKFSGMCDPSSLSVASSATTGRYARHNEHLDRWRQGS